MTPPCSEHGRANFVALLERRATFVALRKERDIISSLLNPPLSVVHVFSAYAGFAVRTLSGSTPAVVRARLVAWQHDVTTHVALRAGRQCELTFCDVLIHTGLLSNEGAMPTKLQMEQKALAAHISERYVGGQMRQPSLA
jgi:hypothetical protein